jgi:LmbE family N-acetylglucosaminyl deacetylase
MQSLRTLIVAAHPDDEVLGCGGTIARLRDVDAPVRVLFLAEGITARYDPPQFSDAKVLAEIQQRNLNASKALDLLGVPKAEVFTAQRYCCRLDEVPLIDLSKEIERHIRDFKPQRLFCHAPDDVNVDHRLCHQAALAAARPLNQGALKAMFAFEVLSSTEWNPLKPFPATAFVDITTTLDRKVAAMAAYEGEMRSAPHPRSGEVIRALATYRGAQAGVTAAEGFALVRGLDL